MHRSIILVLWCAVISLVLGAPKNTFRPWKIGMGSNPARPMAVADPAKYESIVGQIAKPKDAKSLKGTMPPPAGPEPELQVQEVKKTDGRPRREKDRTDGKLKKEKEGLLEQGPGKIGAWRGE